MIIKQLNEDKKLEQGKTLDSETKQAASTLGKEVKVSVVANDAEDDDGLIEKQLNDTLRANMKRLRRHIYKGGSNCLFVGAQGTGKTARVIDWAKRHNINLYTVRASGMDATDLGGAIAPDAQYKDVVKRLASTEFDKLDRPNSVLFLDEYNRAPEQVRTNLFQLINDHEVPDARTESGQRTFKHMLFTVACINPDDVGNYDVHSLNDAELGRFGVTAVPMEKPVWLRWFTKTMQNNIKEDIDDGYAEDAIADQNVLDMITLIVKNKEFQFDDDKTTTAMKGKYAGQLVHGTTGRTLTNMASEVLDGKKETLYNKWNKFCNPDQLPLVKRILANFVEKDDKATQLLNNKKTDNPTIKDNPVFSKTSSYKDRFKSISGKNIDDIEDDSNN